MLEIHDIGTSNLPDAARLCLAGTSPADRPKAFTKDVELDCTRCKLSFLREAMGDGSKACAAYRAGMLVGYLEYHPIASSLQPVDGDNCFVIQCMRVPEARERDEVEAALVAHAADTWSGSRGAAVLARDKDWSVHGFQEIERVDAAVSMDARVLWWRQETDGDPPSIVKVAQDLNPLPGKVRVDLFVSDRCPWNKFVFDLVRGVCDRMTDQVVVYETNCGKREAVLRSGVGAGIALNGRFQPWLRPYRLPDEHTIRRAIEDAV